MLKDAAETGDKICLAGLGWHNIGRFWLVMFMPVACNVDAFGDPDFVVALYVIEETLQCCRASRTTNQTAVKANRHHLRRTFCTLTVKHVERIFEVGVELIAGVKALWCCKAHIIGVERIRHNEMRTFRSLDPIRQFIGIGIGGIEKAAFLHHKLERVIGRFALINAKRT